jgi:hypothetical protein
MILSLIAPMANTALVAPSVGAPDCNIWLAQSGITAGSATQLTWWTMNAGNAMLSDGTGSYPVGASGQETITPASSRTYTLVVTGAAGGSKTCSVSIVVSPSTSAAPTCSLSATPGTHRAGQAVRLVWYSQNATAGTLSNSGALQPNELSQGSRDVYPTQSTLYTMTVGNNSGSRTCAALVTIGPGSGTGTTYNSGYTTYTSGTSYRPVTSQTTYTISSPSYSNSYVTARPLVTSGWYPNPVLNTRSYSSPSYYGGDIYTSSPSYTNGLGDWSLTNVWNDAASGAYLETNRDCYGYSCAATPSSWSYGDDSFSQYGGYDENGYVQNRVYDNYGNLTASASEEDPYPLDWYSSAGATPSNDYQNQDLNSYSVPGVGLGAANDNYWDNAYPSAPATSPFDYYPSSAYDSVNQSSQGDMPWYQFSGNTWDGGTDPNSSGVYYGGDWGTSEYSI